MPYKALKPCRYHGCQNLTSGRHCDRHRLQRAQAIEAERPSSYQRGYDSKWAGYSRRYLREHPYCVICGHQSQKVDHIVSVRRGGSFWDSKNHQAMCIRCHSKKTVAQDGSRRNTPPIFPRPLGNTTLWPTYELDRNGALG